MTPNEPKVRSPHFAAETTRSLARGLTFIAALGSLTGCGVVYNSPAVRQGTVNGSEVEVIRITAETVSSANLSPYSPRTLPREFNSSAGTGTGLRGSVRTPEQAFESQTRSPLPAINLPSELPVEPYRIGVGDVVVLATQQTDTTLAELSGLLSVQNRRQGFTVHDDGSISLPDIGRIKIEGLSLEDAESAVFQQFLDHQIDPTFSLEISEFVARRVSVGGAVRTPSVIPITLTPTYLDEALALVGGTTERDRSETVVRLYRAGRLYQIPLSDLTNDRNVARVRLLDGDRVFVDESFDIELAAAYFKEQISLQEFRQASRNSALEELSTAVALRRAELDERRLNFSAQMEYEAVERDYVYLTGEVGTQSRFALPFNQQASLADALYDSGGGIPTETANVRQIYVLRGSADPVEIANFTAWQLDGSQAVNFVLATRFEMRPNDVIFVAEQPVTRWGRIIQQVTPSLITTQADISSRR